MERVISRRRASLFLPLALAGCPDGATPPTGGTTPVTSATTAVPASGSPTDPAADPLAGGVFTEDMIEAYAESKMTEVTRLRQAVHPIEFDMYYSL